MGLNGSIFVIVSKIVGFLGIRDVFGKMVCFFCV